MRKFLIPILLFSNISFAQNLDAILALDLKPFLFDRCEQIQENYSICLDQTVSFKQPDSTGINGYEGKCGQTAGANVIAHHCQDWRTPKDLDQLMSDATPGVLPKTLARVLNSEFQKNNCARGSWKVVTHSSQEAFIKTIFASELPLPSLLYLKGGALHWVTIVKLEGDADLASKSCFINVNTWAHQYRLPCADYAQMAEDVTRVTVGVIGKLVLVQFKKL